MGNLIMNYTRRRTLGSIQRRIIAAKTTLDQIAADLETVREAEQAACDNMDEYLNAASR